MVTWSGDHGDKGLDRTTSSVSSESSSRVLAEGIELITLRETNVLGRGKRKYLREMRLCDRVILGFAFEATRFAICACRILYVGKFVFLSTGKGDFTYLSRA